jgi:hypothetical protein
LPGYSRLLEIDAMNNKAQAVCKALGGEVDHLRTRLRVALRDVSSDLPPTSWPIWSRPNWKQLRRFAGLRRPQCDVFEPELGTLVGFGRFGCCGAASERKTRHDEAFTLVLYFALRDTAPHEVKHEHEQRSPKPDSKPMQHEIIGHRVTRPCRA